MKLLSVTNFNLHFLSPWSSLHIQGFHNGVVEDSRLVGCDAVSQGEWFPVFWRIFLDWLPLIIFKGKQPKKILSSTTNCSPSNIACHPGRHESSYSSLFHNQQILFIQVSFKWKHENQSVKLYFPYIHS